jgi:hypothetical protein
MTRFGQTSSPSRGRRELYLSRPSGYGPSKATPPPHPDTHQNQYSSRPPARYHRRRSKPTGPEHSLFESFFSPCLCVLITATTLTGETFRNPRHIPLSVSPASIGTADFNRDHRHDFYYNLPDISHNHRQLGILLAQSDGTYVDGPPVLLPAGTNNCRAYDVDADGASDSGQRLLLCGRPCSCLKHPGGVPTADTSSAHYH